MSTKTTVQPAPHRWVAHPEWQSPYGVPIYAVDRNERDEREHIANVFLEADAHLIAAAPELLSIVRRFLALPGGAWHQERFAADTARLESDARAAVAKAEGR